MPCFDIVKTHVADESFRVSNVRSSFDLQDTKITEHFKGNIDIENINWNVGLIVGASGTGKSTIAKEVFKDYYINDYQYSANSVIEDMPKTKYVNDIFKTFSCVVFSSPPSWLKSYSVLSTGEKMRVDLARSLLEERDIIVFDEFTSVVNREVAKTGSFAISKAVKNLNKKFIAVSCHSDIIEWLEPDWIYNTDTQVFQFAEGSSVGHKSRLKSMNLLMKINIKSGKFLGNIII